jgi:hypothetical protein
MELAKLPQLPLYPSQQKATRTTRRKGNGSATAALLIQMASEILTASPTLRKKVNITLTDLAAADKVRKELNRKSNLSPQ